MWACEERGGKDEWSNALGLMRCIGYLDGVMDSAVVLSIAHPEARPFCLPETGISLDQARLIFIKWAKDHPDQLHTAARISVAIALGTAFPCK
jgi:hypothetical protein